MTDQADLVRLALDDIEGLPSETRETLCALVSEARESLGDNLSSVVLYGSAAEGRLRATSDINLLVVLTRFTQGGIDPLRETLRLARTVADVKAMFVLQDELPAAAEAFAMKFADIAHRRRVLYGEDPMQTVYISRESMVRRLRQVLLNVAIRQRERYAMVSLREEQLALELAEITGPLRVAASTLLDLQGRSAASGKEAIEMLAPALGVDGWQDALANLSTARETRILPPGVASATFFTLLEMTESMRRLADRM